MRHLLGLHPLRGLPPVWESYSGECLGPEGLSSGRCEMRERTAELALLEAICPLSQGYDGRGSCHLPSRGHGWLFSREHGVFQGAVVSVLPKGCHLKPVLRNTSIMQIIASAPENMVGKGLTW